MKEKADDSLEKQEPKEKTPDSIEKQDPKEETAKKSEKKPQNSEDSRRNDKILLFAGIPASVLLALIVQYFYNNFYVLPLEERTLVNVATIEHTQKHWSVDRKYSSLYWKYGNDAVLSMDILGNDGETKLITVNQNFGYFKAGNLDVKYVVIKNSWKAELFVTTAHGANVDVIIQTPSQTKTGDSGFEGTSEVVGNYSLLIPVNEDQMTFDGNIVKLMLKPGQKTEIQFNVNSDITDESFENYFKEAESEFNEEFDKIFTLKSKGMPEFYQSMGRTGLSFLISSLESKERALEAKGKHNSRFYTESLPVTTFKISDGDANAQVLSSIPLIDYSPLAVEKIFFTWFNLVNSHANIPSNLTEPIDYSTDLSFSIFYLLDLYIDKHGVEGLKPIYKSIEKLGLKIVEEKNLFEGKLNLLESSDEVKASKYYSVEKNCLAIITSRALVKLSTAFGDPAVAQKFKDSNSRIDSFEYILEHFKDGDHIRDFVLEQKDGKEVKSFTGSRSLAPLLYKLVLSDAEFLKNVLQELENPEIFWSNYGIRIAPKAEGSPKGISLPHNFHILKALSFYAHQSNPNQDVAHMIYAKLRGNLIMYVAREFKKTGTFWEFYSDENGEGQGSKDYLPSVIVLQILAELF